MGQSNQAQNQQADPGSSCCFSRRYIIHTNLQKQNKLRQKNQKSASFYNHEVQIYSKQPFRQDINVKLPTNNIIPSITQFKVDEKKFNKEKHLKIQEIANLGMESQLVEQVQVSNKKCEFNNQKKQILQLPDFSQENERNSTRENSLSQRNFSNKNFISSNNHKLRNKIKNLKLKYVGTQETQTKGSVSFGQQKNVSQKQKHFTEKFQQNKFVIECTSKNTINQNIKIFQNQLFRSKKHQQSEEIQFFSQDSDSDESSSNSGSNNRNNQINEQMLNSQKIDLIVHELNKNLKINKNIKKIAYLQRIPEESQRIHSSRSQDQLSYPVHKISSKNHIPEKIKEESFEYHRKSDKKSIQQQRVENFNKKACYSKNEQQIAQKVQIKEDGTNKKKIHSPRIERGESFENKQVKIQEPKLVSEKKVNNKIPKTIKKVIAF